MNVMKMAIPTFVSTFSLLLILQACGEPDTGASGLTLRVLYPQSGLGDRSFADSAYRGIRVAANDIRITKIDAIPQSVAQAESIYVDWLNTAPKEPEVLLIVGQLYSPFVREQGCLPDDRYLVLLDDDLPSCPNRVSVRYRTFAPSFLAGVVAAEMAPEGRVAAIGGMDLPTVNEFLDGFAAGAVFAGGEVTEILYLSDNADGFDAPEKAKAEAARLYETASVVFPVAGGSGIGAIEAAKQCEPCYALGVDSDQAHMGRSVVLGSVVKYLDRSVEELLGDAAARRWTAGARRVGLEDGGTDFVLNEVFSKRLESVVDSAREAAIEEEKRYTKER